MPFSPKAVEPSLLAGSYVETGSASDGASTQLEDVAGTTLSSDLTLAADGNLKSGSIIKAGSTIADTSTVTSDKIEITVRNSGAVDSTITTIYVKTPEGDQWRQDWTSANVIVKSQTKKFVFTTLHTVSGSTGAEISDVSGIPFGWTTSSTYTVRVVTDSGFVTEAPYSASTTHA